MLKERMYEEPVVEVIKYGVKEASMVVETTTYPHSEIDNEAGGDWENW